jgi:hypothetical protein
VNSYKLDSRPACRPEKGVESVIFPQVQGPNNASLLCIKELPESASALQRIDKYHYTDRTGFHTETTY